MSLLKSWKRQQIAKMLSFKSERGGVANFEQRQHFLQFVIIITENPTQQFNYKRYICLDCVNSDDNVDCLENVGWKRVLINGIVGAVLLGGFEIIFRGYISGTTKKNDKEHPFYGRSEEEKIRIIAEDPNWEVLFDTWREMTDIPAAAEYPGMTLRDWKKLVYLYPTKYPPWEDIPAGEPDPMPGHWFPPPSYYRDKNK
jgi:hypothetical protein